MTSMREQQTLTEGVTSVVCQCGRFYKKQSRTADSSDKEWLSDVWKRISNTQLYLVWRER